MTSLFRNRFVCAIGLFCVAILAPFFLSQVGADGTEQGVKQKPTKPQTTASQNDIEQKKLTTLNGIIGQWRGVGMLRRGSVKGAWREKADWIWNFEKGKPSLSYNISDGKYIKSASIQYDSKKKDYVMQMTLADDTKREYRGDWEKKKFILTSDTQKDGNVYRITVRPLNEKRTIVLQEKRRAAQTNFTRIAEVGYTRKGTSLAIAGAGEPVCVVTGGKGTMKVSYKGKEYYVCCSGCKDAFEDDPEGIIAEYRQKLAEKNKNK